MNQSQADMPLVILDTETTGLSPQTGDGVVELGIIDGRSGEILLHSLVNPWPKKEWSVAQGIHGISPEMVRRSPMIHDLWPAIFKICQGAHVIIYNQSYDRGFFPNGDLRCAAKISCAMAREGTKSHKGGYKWWKLVDAADKVGHDWGRHTAHRAIGDCFATKSVWEWCDRMEAQQRENADAQARVN